MTKVWPMRIGPNLRFYTRFLLVYKNHTFVQLCSERLKKKAIFWFTSGKCVCMPTARIPILFQKIYCPFDRSQKIFRESRANPQNGYFLKHKKKDILCILRSYGRFLMSTVPPKTWFCKAKIWKCTCMYKILIIKGNLKHVRV